MKSLYKTLLLAGIFLMSFGVNAYDYDPLLMRAQATIFPKIILLDKDINEKHDDGNIAIVILHAKQESAVAENLKGLIFLKYMNHLGKNKLTVETVDFDSFDQEKVATAYFLLKGTNEIHEKITSHAASKKRLVFSYDYKDFTNNALISILMKEKTYIYLNKQAIHSYDINFLPLFYKIVKVIE